MTIQAHTLENGLSIILEENHAAPVISFNALIKVGSAFESQDEAGLSHVIEHMLFKGTPTRPVGAIAREVEAAGGDINAYTSFDQTVYYINMASRYADRGLDILADAVQHPLFDPAELKREQEVILEEVRREHDNPSHVVSELLFQTAYEHHPYGRPIIGYPKTITSFDRDRLFAFYHRWYTPRNMAFIIIGDFKTKNMLEKIRKSFGDFSGENELAPHITLPDEPEQRRTRLATKSMNIQSTHFSVGFHIPAIIHHDVPAIDVLTHILGGGDSSRLEQEVKEKKRLVHRISSFAFTPRLPGLLLISGTCMDTKGAKALQAMRHEIDRLQNDLVKTTELSRAKINIRSSEIYERETVGGQAGKLAYFLATAGDYDFEKRYYQALVDVDAESVRRVAQQYLAAENCTTTLVTPITSTWKKQSSFLIRSLKHETRKHFPRTIGEKDIIPEVVRLRNGLTMLIRENHTLPIVCLVAAALGGTRYETSLNNGVSVLTANTLTKGTKSRSAVTIANEIEGMAGSIEGFSGRNALGLKCEVLSDHLRDGFSLFADLLLHPAFEAREVEKEKRLLLQAIRDQEDALGQLAFIHFLKSLFPQHPYGLRTLGSHKTVSRLTSSALVRYWQGIMRAHGTVLSIVGDVSPAEVKELGEELLAKLPMGKQREPRIPLDRPPDEIRRIEITKRDKQQAHLVLGFQGPQFASNDHYTMLVLNNILSGQGGRLFLKLRDQMSLAYAVSSVLQPGIDPGHFAVYIGTEPTKVDTAIKAMKEELNQIRCELVEDEEFERSRQHLVGTYELELQRNSSLASAYAFNKLYGIGLNEIVRYPQKIMEVTRQDVQRVARKYIRLDAYVLSVIRPG